MYTFGAGPTGRKAYILDEIHTVSDRAADRLLSVLESLPKHVLLIGATTEASWIDAQRILFSRWVKLQLQKPRASDVAAHLERIAEQEGLPVGGPGWAEKMVKYAGLNIRDLINQLPAALLSAA